MNHARSQKIVMDGYGSYLGMEKGCARAFPIVYHGPSLFQRMEWTGVKSRFSNSNMGEPTSFILSSRCARVLNVIQVKIGKDEGYILMSLHLKRGVNENSQIN